MSLWHCAEHGIYGPEGVCPTCGKQGAYCRRFATEPQEPAPRDSKTVPLTHRGSGADSCDSTPLLPRRGDEVLVEHDGRFVDGLVTALPDEKHASYRVVLNADGGCSIYDVPSHWWGTRMKPKPQEGAPSREPEPPVLSGPGRDVIGGVPSCGSEFAAIAAWVNDDGVCHHPRARDVMRFLLGTVEDQTKAFADAYTRMQITYHEQNEELRAKLTTAEADNAELRVRLDIAQQRLTEMEAEKTSNATGAKR